jgi:hypothetical protein
MQQLVETIFSLSQDIRYIAIYNHRELTVSSKSGVVGASSSESDKYEELIVNPAILTLVKQRGEIDCGGAKFVLIRYGNFYQFVSPTARGHISICIEPHADPLPLVESIQGILSQNGLY